MFRHLVRITNKVSLLLAYSYSAFSVSLLFYFCYNCAYFSHNTEFFFTRTANASAFHSIPTILAFEVYTSPLIAISVIQNEISAGGGIVMRTSRFALAYFHYVFKSTMVDFSEELVGHIPTIRNKRNDFLRVYWETNVRHFSIYF